MLNYSRMPLRWRLTLLITLVCTLTLGAAFGGYFLIGVFRLRDDVAQKSHEIAGLLSGRVTSILETNPEPSIKDLPLRVWLTDYDNIVAAVVYSPKNLVLASPYIRPDSGASIGSLRTAITGFSTDDVVISYKLM